MLSILKLEESFLSAWTLLHHMENITEDAETIVSVSIADTERTKEIAMQEGRKLHLEFEKERFSISPYFYSIFYKTS